MVIGVKKAIMRVLRDSERAMSACTAARKALGRGKRNPFPGSGKGMGIIGGRPTASGGDSGVVQPAKARAPSLLGLPIARRVPCGILRARLTAMATDNGMGES